MWSSPMANMNNLDMDFVYDDADSQANELAELYCYSEEQEILNNQTAFQQVMRAKGFPVKWCDMSEIQKSLVIQQLADGIELVDEIKRWEHLQAMFYLMQGTFGECETIDECFIKMRQNVMSIYSSGVFGTLIQILVWETDKSSSNIVPTGGQQQQQQQQQSVNEEVPMNGGSKKSVLTLNDSFKLRTILSMIYTIVEVMRTKDEKDTDEEERMRQQLREELSEPMAGTNELLAIFLFQMITKFGNNTCPHFPIRKILLLVWKVLLVTLGGSEELVKLKSVYRKESGLPEAPDDTLDVCRTMRASSPPINVNEALEAQNQRKINKPLKRQMFVKQTSVVAGEESNDSEANDSMNEDELLPDEGISEPELEKLSNSSSGDPSNDSASASAADEKIDMGGRPAGPRPDTPTSGSLGNKTIEDEEVEMVMRMKKGLPWTPKIRDRDIDSFLDYTRQKFIGFQLLNDRTTTFGLPEPILESLLIMRKHVYVSLTEIQIKREEDLMKYPLTHREELISLSSPTERLYQAMLPTLSQCVISLLKILLAASPTSRAKNDSMNIVSDCLPEEMPMSVVQSVVQSMKIGIDVNRHKEVIIKSISGILILLLKHLKINHVYQFEYMSQQLMFANCIPLVLKFLNQNTCQFVGSRNTISVIDFPVCVIGEQPELTTENLDVGVGGDPQIYSWRNMFSCINLLRILNKLTKWKHSRIMMLVVFKSAPILKKSLKLRHAMLQLYILKLLKIQAKYLGRQWRKSNMKTLSAIYQKVRHRLTDDWAFGNDVDSRPWDFQAQEFSLQASINRFHHRRYSSPNQQQPPAVAPNQPNANPLMDADAVAEMDLLEEVDNNFLSVLSKRIILPQTFRDNYETWLQREVYDSRTDWDQLMCATNSSSCL